MVERSWEYYKEEEGRKAQDRWVKIAKQVVISNNLSLSELFCLVDKEKELAENTWVQEIDDKLYICGECSFCHSQSIMGLLPEEHFQFAQYYFFGENSNIMDEPAPEIKVGFDNRLQLPFSNLKAS